MAVFKSQKEKLVNDGPDKLNVIVDGAVIKGDINVLTSIRIAGKVEGNVSCAAKFVLSDSGMVIGNISTQSAEIEGVVEGELKIQDRLVLKSTARIKGNIQTKILVIEEGATFEGVCNMVSSSDSKVKESSSGKLKSSQEEGMVY